MSLQSIFESVINEAFILGHMRKEQAADLLKNLKFDKYSDLFVRRQHESERIRVTNDKDAIKLLDGYDNFELLKSSVCDDLFHEFGINKKGFEYAIGGRKGYDNLYILISKSLY